MEQNKYQYRFLARVVIEAKTPLAVGSGDKDLLTDSVVARDVNGLPFIPGTAIAGIIRHAMEEQGLSKQSFFGFNESKKEKRKKEGDKRENIDKGSEIIFSSAQIIDENGKAVEGLISSKFDYLQNFDELPIRQHVRINAKGTADTENHGKFDEQVVFKGTRFCFEIELLSKENNDANFTCVLNELANDTIRIGGGTRKGFGEIEIVECRCLNFCLNHDLQQDSKDSQDYLGLDKYIEKTSSLNDEIWKSYESSNPENSDSENWTTYQLLLSPDDFFLFGSGFGDDEADMTPVTESFIDWPNGEPEFKKNTILIPGSSVKGAVAHRVAFHYNKLKEVFAESIGVEKIPELINKGYKLPFPFDSKKKGDFEEMIIRSGNPAVRALFGYTSQDEKKQQRGNVLISDVIQEKDKEKSKILNHVSIDRFTGGAIEGALFSEEVTYGKDETYTLTFKVNNKAIETDKVQKAFEAALTDITTGMLPLGGGTNRGHGCFNGKCLNRDLQDYRINKKN